MKAIVLAIGLLAGSLAFASSKHAAKDCTPYSMNQGEVVTWVYPCGESYTVKYRSCTEGEVAYFPVNDARNGEVTREEARTCHNGTFFPNYRSEVGHRGCIEGEIAHSNEYGYGGELQDVRIVCHHGRFVRAH